MQSAWRVACVRIPRFPIGAVWRHVAGERAGAERAERPRAARLGEAQLPLPIPAVSGPDASAAAQSRQWDETTFAFEPQAEKETSDRQGVSPLPQSSPHWDDLPLALADGQRLRAVSAAAGRFRVRAGMTVAESRSRCAALEVLAWDDTIVTAEITRATAAFIIASPQVTPVAGAPGMWWIGAGGLDALGGERALIRTLLRIARLWHPRARVAVADSCVAARAGTWAGVGGETSGERRETSAINSSLVSRHSSLIVPRGGCAAYLAPAPLGLIPMEEELRQALVALGLRTVGAFAALEAEDVERRWGASGLAAWRLARGDDRRRPVLSRVEAKRCVSAELALPASTTEPVLFLVRAALDRLVRELVADGRAAAGVAITLTLDDGRGALPSGGIAHTITREARPARPLARVAPLFERCRALLDRWPLTAPVSGVAVAITATAPSSGEQGELLDPAWRDPAAADAALEHLRAELGPNVIVRPIACDEHRPERAGAWVEGARSDGRRATGDETASEIPMTDTATHAPTDVSRPTAEEGGRARPPSPVARRSSRLLESPEPIEVECVRDVPHLVRWRGRRMLVGQAVGPERLAGDWWKDGYARDYWRCEADDGRSEFIIFLDHAGGWFLHAWYD